MSVTCEGITFFDLRTTVKTVAGEAISMGESCYIASDGEAYVVDNGKSDVVHGWALNDASENDKITLATTCRMQVDTSQTKGARLYTGSVAGGSAPSTTLASNGVVCGFAVDTYKIHCQIPTPGADG